MSREQPEISGFKELTTRTIDIPVVVIDLYSSTAPKVLHDYDNSVS